VAEHRIRLRGAWDCQNSASSTEPPERITLPIRWDPRNPRRLRLSRRFGCPPADFRCERLLLELDQARGIHSLCLNGTALAAVSPAKSYYLIALPEIEERNILVLEIETGAACEGTTESDPDWGRIAILVRPIEEGTDG
jgi:hypothetical protein